MVGIRDTDWNTNPTLVLRRFSLARSDSLHTSCPPISTLPEVGTSSAPTMFSSVVLPDPERPFNIVSTPAGISAQISARA